MGVDILRVDILGVVILKLDVMALPHSTVSFNWMLTASTALS